MEFDLVFEGGGAKGSVFVGALEEFEKRGHTARRRVGTSAGSIIATLLTAGYTPQELLAAVNEKINGKSRFTTFMDTPESFDESVIENSLTIEAHNKAFPVAISGLGNIFASIDSSIQKHLMDSLMKFPPYRQAFSFVELGGLFAGDKFLEWIIEKLAVKNQQFSKSTFSQFFSMTGQSLTVVASDTMGTEMLVLNHITAPDCPVVWGVRMSMSIPFCWQEVTWKGEWGLYRGRDITGHTIVDGGVLSNFPIELVASMDEKTVELMGKADRCPYLGLLIDETLPVEGSPAKQSEKSNKVIDRVKRLVDTMMTSHDKSAISNNEKKIIRLPAMGYGTTEFDMSDERLQALINAGRKAATEYFDKQG